MIRLGIHRTARAIVITSPSAGDGKSTTASNLAIAFAQAGERTLLIDGDLRGPVQHLIFEVDPQNGLSTAINGEMNVRLVIHRSGIERLDVIACGPLPTSPSESLGSSRFAEILRDMSAGIHNAVVL